MNIIKPSHWSTNSFPLYTVYNLFGNFFRWLICRQLFSWLFSLLENLDCVRLIQFAGKLTIRISSSICWPVLENFASGLTKILTYSKSRRCWTVARAVRLLESKFNLRVKPPPPFSGVDTGNLVLCKIICGQTLAQKLWLASYWNCRARNWSEYQFYSIIFSNFPFVQA